MDHGVVDSRWRSASDLGVFVVRIDLIGDRFEFRNTVEPFGGNPRFDARTAPVGTDQPDWHVEVPVKPPTEKVANGRKAARRAWLADLPLPRTRLLGDRRCDMPRDVKKAKLWMVCRSDLLLAVQ